MEQMIYCKSCKTAVPKTNDSICVHCGASNWDTMKLNQKRLKGKVLKK